MSPPVSSELGAAELRAPDGSARPLRMLWQERPALILWVRHFG